MSIASDVSALKALSDGVVANKVSRFAYTEQAYTDNEVNGVTAYDVNAEQNIPVGTPSVMKVNQTVVEKGWRARASSITRMLMNHFLGRISYNLNKINDWFNSFLGSVSNYLGQANGIATLDGDGLVPYTQLPVLAKTVNNVLPNAQRDVTLTIGKNIPATREFLGAVFGKQLFRHWKEITVPVGWEGFSGFPVASENILVGIGLGHSGIWWSEDAKIWAQGTGIDASWKMAKWALCYADGVWVCGSSNDNTYGKHGIWWSEDGKAWTQGTGIATTDSIGNVEYANGIWVCSASSGMYWSADGKAWTQGTGAGASTSTEDLSHSGGMWHILDNTIYWSIDGKVWTACTGVTLTPLPNVDKEHLDMDTDKNMDYGNGLWVWGCRSGALWSDDGKAWHETTGWTTPDPNYYNSVGFVRFGAVGRWVCYYSYSQDATVDGTWCSTNGKSWAKADTPVRWTPRTMRYTFGTFIQGTQGGGILWSSEGSKWYFCNGSGEPVASSNNMVDIGFRVITSYNGLLVGMSDRGMFYSTDGKNWQLGSNLYYIVGNPVYFKGTWLIFNNNDTKMYVSDIETLIESGEVSLGDVTIVD